MAFLHGNFKKEIYMEQSEGFKVKIKKHMVCNLKKRLYVIK